MNFKVACISFSDGPGGAGKAAFKIHTKLLNSDVESRMIVSEKSTDNEAVLSLPKNMRSKFIRVFDYLISKVMGKADYKTFSNDFFSEIDYRYINKKFDAVIFFWIGGGLVNSSTISKIKIPIIWRLSDTMALTGGCHYPGDCVEFQNGCKNCPQLKRSNIFSVSKINFTRKKQKYSQANLTIACPSRWIEEVANRSLISRNLRICYIPTGIDETIFCPRKNNELYPFNFSRDKKIVLFGASGAVEDPRKGFQYFFDLIKKNKRDDIQFVIFGNKVEFKALSGLQNVSFLGNIEDQVKLSLLYSSCDVFVAPSLEDNLPNTVLESLACGTPVCAFSIGGNLDVIDHCENGYLCGKPSVNGLSDGVEFLLKKKKGYFLKHSRKKILEKFTLDIQNENYLDLLIKILKNRT